MRVLGASERVVKPFRVSRYSQAVYIPKALAEKGPLLRIDGLAELCGHETMFSLLLPASIVDRCTERIGDVDRWSRMGICMQRCMARCREKQGDSGECVELCAGVCAELVYGV